MRRLMLLPTLVAAAAAQESMPVFRATTRLVEVTVTAVDASGKPITGLQKEDFTVSESGKPQTIALFQFEGAPLAPSSIASLPPGVSANSLDTAASPVRNVVALVLDGLNTAPVDNVQARAQVARYLKTLTPLTRVAVYVLDRDLRVLHDFTDDPDELRRRIEQAALPVPVHADSKIEESIAEAEEMIRMFPDDTGLAHLLRNNIETEMVADVAMRKARAMATLRAMEALGRHLAGIRGRKTLIWVSGGFSMLLTTGSGGTGPRGGIEGLEKEVRAVGQRLAQRGVALHLVDARGLDPAKTLAMLEARPEKGGGRFADLSGTNEGNKDPDAASTLMTSITGGRYLKNTNDMSSGISAAIADVQGSYTLGFYTSREDDKWHGLQVRVKRDGVRLRYRQGWLAESNRSQANEWSREDWRGIAASPVGSTDIRLKAECRRTGDSLRVNLVIEPDDLAFRPEEEKLAASLHVVLAEINGDKVRMPALQAVDVKVDPRQNEKLRAAGVRYNSTWTPDPGATALRLIVRDRQSGRYGTLDLPGLQ